MRRAEDSDNSSALSGDTNGSDEEEQSNAPEVPPQQQPPQPQSESLAIPVPPEMGEQIANNPNDEVFHVEDDRDVSTPPNADNTHAGGMTSSEGIDAPVDGGRLMANNPNDERVEVHDAEVLPTPRSTVPPSDAGSGEPNRGRLVQQMVPEDDDDDEDDDEEDEEVETPRGFRPTNYAGQKPEAIGPVTESAPSAPLVLPSNMEYNAAKYAKVNTAASREMQDLFKHILDYQPFVAELPAKLRPFIPDYIPAVGELDPFVKVPRPDGHPDGLGLYVIDEPTIPQSNPAVVQLELRATNIHTGASAQVVDSFVDAANRPEVIDRWIADVKKVHYKKPLPTVNYQKPMPEIDTLLQAWPQAFEDLLNSDLQFPPPNIDLDLEQYVRTLCAILDIPTYNSLIDSLHVMFTLYEEFRANQHFQHE